MWNLLAAAWGDISAMFASVQEVGTSIEMPDAASPIRLYPTVAPPADAVAVDAAVLLGAALDVPAPVDELDEHAVSVMPMLVANSSARPRPLPDTLAPFAFRFAWTGMMLVRHATLPGKYRH